MEYQQLLRSRKERIIAGVAGGMGEYFHIDPIIIRILFVVFTLFAGGGLLAYIILWIITPEGEMQFTKLNQEHIDNENTSFDKTRQDNQSQSPKYKGQGNIIGGVILITLGSLFLVDQFVPRINFGDLWPVILIVIGVALLFNSVSSKTKKQDN
ncbi:PspC domain-containing protein [Bacteroidota bacterium]